VVRKKRNSRCSDLSGKMERCSLIPDNDNREEGSIVVKMSNAFGCCLTRKKNGKDCFVFELRDLK
jgi:hypothetical protein